MTTRDDTPAVVELRPDTIQIVSRQDHDGQPLVGLKLDDPQLGPFVVAFQPQAAFDVSILLAHTATQHGVTHA
ncbi:hypothetical protein [Mycobacterium riyadhense]|uniref:hypothetical protein n=1 Tax=Mycobacterium riyadhense TaxID=486698 RepID=UPI001957BFDA|nr:hypothetical protein [Mycobacterium riyadhense]